MRYTVLWRALPASVRIRHMKSISAIGAAAGVCLLLVLALNIAIIYDPVSVDSGTASMTPSNGKLIRSAESKPIVAQSAVVPPIPQQFKTTMTTLFWAGEPSDSDNGFIANDQSFWDEKWMEHFGGLDDPTDRCGYRPCAFMPKENPFYVALPYGDYDENGRFKESAKHIPWFPAGPAGGKELLKNRWVAVRYGSKTCYAQWEDVGPFESDDFSYVFGTSSSENTYGERAGLDVSPAVWDCLGISDNATTSWAFIDEARVPSGPWRDIVTTSGTSWTN